MSKKRLFSLLALLPVSLCLMNCSSDMEDIDQSTKSEDQYNAEKHLLASYVTVGEDGFSLKESQIPSNISSHSVEKFKIELRDKSLEVLNDAYINKVDRIVWVAGDEQYIRQISDYTESPSIIEQNKNTGIILRSSQLRKLSTIFYSASSTFWTSTDFHAGPTVYVNASIVPRGELYMKAIIRCETGFSLWTNTSSFVYAAAAPRIENLKMISDKWVYTGEKDKRGYYFWRFDVGITNCLITVDFFDYGYKPDRGEHRESSNNPDNESSRGDTHGQHRRKDDSENKPDRNHGGRNNGNYGRGCTP
ncbi:hypothetical protein [Tannerella forsythia]|uniref:hypothetical protein n=1 Tax=Tannerella forsythia TaxID=28112 RepID=UPI00086BE3A0|nr:hypothetical protein [Tannerella forsythia]SCQ20362.1 hypothetical protein TFUB22_00847 [Tannerella forsythia]